MDNSGDGATDFIASRGNNSPHDGLLEQVRTETPVPVFTCAWPHEEDSRQQPIPRDLKACIEIGTFATNLYSPIIKRFG